jgi:hypothetical protein
MNSIAIKKDYLKISCEKKDETRGYLSNLHIYPPLPYFIKRPKQIAALKQDDLTSHALNLCQDSKSKREERREDEKMRRKQMRRGVLQDPYNENAKGARDKQIQPRRSTDCVIHPIPIHSIPNPPSWLQKSPDQISLRDNLTPRNA